MVLLMYISITIIHGNRPHVCITEEVSNTQLIHQISKTLQCRTKLNIASKYKECVNYFKSWICYYQKQIYEDDQCLLQHAQHKITYPASLYMAQRQEPDPNAWWF